VNFCEQTAASEFNQGHSTTRIETFYEIYGVLRKFSIRARIFVMAKMLAALALFLLPCAGAAELPSWAVVPTGQSHHLVSFTEDERKAALRAGPIDWVERGAVTPPTSQGRCAYFAYFAGTAAVEGAWKIAGHPLVKLSEQEEIDCYNNGGYAMPNMVHGIARNVDAPLANHSDPNITGCRDITNCTHANAHPWAYINGTRGSTTHMDADVLALLQSGPAAVSIDAAAYSPYHGGIINCTGLRGVDHANALVGYGLEPPPEKCTRQPANSSYETYCETAFPLGAGGREWWGGIPGVPKGGKVTLEECCAACANEVGTPPEKPAWNTPRCGAANWQNGVCTMMATDPTGHHYTGMATHTKNVTACVPFKRAPIATEAVGYFKVKNSWGGGFVSHCRRPLRCSVFARPSLPAYQGDTLGAVPVSALVGTLNLSLR
jgi:hypothetical protein